MLLQSHPTGNANVRQTLQAIDDAGLLAEFWTCINWKPDSALARMVPGSVRQQFARRTFAPTRAKIRTLPWREVCRLLALRTGQEKLTRHETGVCSVDAVFRGLDRHVAKQIRRFPDLKGVYAQEDGALDTFKVAKQRGLVTFYDLPIAYWREGQAIYKEERERQPEWAMTLSGARDSEAKTARKDEELSLADVVFVASSFTERSLQLADNCHAGIHRISYGAPPVADEAEMRPSNSQKLRVLFVGSLGQRKGMSYLLSAVEALAPYVELTLIGAKPDAACQPLERALQTHRYLASLPHAQVLREMRGHDVFLFPSLFEGFGLVILEAMSQGMPVIATPNTAGPDIISEGEDGFVVPIRSAEAIQEKLELLINDRSQLKEMRFAARRKALSCTWESYREKQLAAITSTLAEQ